MSEVVVRLVEALPRGRRLVAIDGRPLAGKSTLALALEARLGAAMIGVDDFFSPHGELAPAWPFPFSRFAELVAAVQSLARTGACEYRAFDWGVHWERPWRELYLPSVEIYLRTDPRSRADHIVAGRGA